MEEGPKLVYRKTLIQINNGKAYGRQGKAPTGLILLLSRALIGYSISEYLAPATETEVNNCYLFTCRDLSDNEIKELPLGIFSNLSSLRTL